MAKLNEFQLNSILHKLDNNMKGIKVYTSIEGPVVSYNFHISDSHREYYIRLPYRTHMDHSIESVFDYLKFLINIFHNLCIGDSNYNRGKVITDSIIAKYIIDNYQSLPSNTYTITEIRHNHIEGVVKEFISEFVISNPQAPFLDIFNHVVEEAPKLLFKHDDINKLPIRLC